MKASSQPRPRNAPQPMSGSPGGSPKHQESRKCEGEARGGFQVLDSRSRGMKEIASARGAAHKRPASEEKNLCGSCSINPNLQEQGEKKKKVY